VTPLPWPPRNHSSTVKTTDTYGSVSSPGDASQFWQRFRARSYAAVASVLLDAGEASRITEDVAAGPAAAARWAPRRATLRQACCVRHTKHRSRGQGGQGHHGNDRQRGQKDVTTSRKRARPASQGLHAGDLLEYVPPGDGVDGHGGPILAGRGRLSRTQRRRALIHSPFYRAGRGLVGFCVRMARCHLGACRPQLTPLGPRAASTQSP
jgi:hypothetical protein